MRLVAFGDFTFTTAANGSIVQGEPEFSGARRSGLVEIPGASGAFRLHGAGPSPKSARQLTQRLTWEATQSLTTDALLDAFLKEAAKGLQWLRVQMRDNSYRRTWAECVDAPRQSGGRTVVPQTLTFELPEPYWYADSQTTTPFTVSATPTACDLNNLGTAKLIKAILRYTGTANRPKWTNNTNGFSIELNRNIAVSKVVEVNLATQTVTYDGASDWANVVLPATQIGLFEFAVGANDVDFTAAGGGSPSGTVEYVYRWMYE